MKTLGELLQAARSAKNYSLEDIAHITKIEIKHIRALENNDYGSLPHSTFTKGFIRSYAKTVGKNPDELIAIYRRDSVEQAQTSPPGNGLNFSLKNSLLSISKSTLIPLVIGILVFFGYLTFQYRALLLPPHLIITQPSPSAVVVSPVTIEGKTSPDSIITINQDTRVKPDQSGIFLTQINFAPGDYQISISATNRFNRTSTKTLNISVISKE